MGWPTMSDYQEVVQNPKHCFSDGQLKTGSPTLNPLGLPQPVTGGFASVYQLNVGKTRWAVRCFLHKIPDIQERYALISSYLKSRPVRFMVGFDYLAEGIRVRGDWYPVLKMEWVEGQTLNVFVEKNLQNPKTLLKAAERWLALIAALEKAGVSHCDLQHGNVLANGGELKLIDYDGMYVPALKGRGSHEKGHPAYQHPHREGKDFNPDIDRFPALVIYLSFLAVARSPELWQRYYVDDNLLFRRTDFLDPDTAPVFKALESHQDSTIARLAQVLHQACKQPLDRTPRLEDAVDGKGMSTPASAPAPAPAAPSPPPKAPPPRAAPPPRPPPPPRYAPPPRPAPVAVSVAPQVIHGSSRPATAPAASGTAVAELYTPPPPPAKPAPAKPSPARPAPAKPAPAKPAPPPKAPGWTVEWVRPGQMKERHVYKVPVYGSRQASSRFLGIFRSKRTKKFIERYEDRVEQRTSTVDGHHSSITCLAFSPDGRTLASGSMDRTVRVWTVATGREACILLEERSRIMALDFIPGRSALAVALEDRRLIIWDYGLQREVIHLSTPDGSRLQAVAASPDGRWLAAGGSGRSLFVWQADRGNLARTFLALDGKVEALAFSHDGESILCAMQNGRLQAVERGSGKTLWSLKTSGGQVAAVVMPPRGRHAVAGSIGGSIAHYDMRTGEEERKLRVSSIDGIRCLALSSDGQNLAAGLWDRTARICDTTSAREVARLEGHPGPVTAVALSASPRSVVTGSRDGSIRLWVPPS